MSAEDQHSAIVDEVVDLKRNQAWGQDDLFADLMADAGAGAGALRAAPVPNIAEWEKMTRLAAIAGVDHGATWVVPFDADEVWYSGFGRLGDLLADLGPRQVEDHPAFAQPDNAGKGVIALDGRMVEELHRVQAERTLARAGLS